VVAIEKSKNAWPLNVGDDDTNDNEHSSDNSNEEESALVYRIKNALPIIFKE
jgi:hypothetical protein